MVVRNWQKMPGWEIMPFTSNHQCSIANPGAQPSTWPINYTINGIPQTDTAFPHTEMIFDPYEKSDLADEIDNY